MHRFWVRTSNGGMTPNLEFHVTWPWQMAGYLSPFLFHCIPNITKPFTGIPNHMVRMIFLYIYIPMTFRWIYWLIYQNLSTPQKIIEFPEFLGIWRVIPWGKSTEKSGQLFDRHVGGNTGIPGKAMGSHRLMHWSHETFHISWKWFVTMSASY